MTSFLSCQLTSLFPFIKQGGGAHTQNGDGEHGHAFPLGAHVIEEVARDEGQAEHSCVASTCGARRWVRGEEALACRTASMSWCYLRNT